ncbi:HTTM domain-containing protein [Natronorarus salvus]|uniref:HTTM domain-containing protein n=1 Tax=Natronorarus salvus TaxID=3117733 RepID=UPI002F26149A
MRSGGEISALSGRARGYLKDCVRLDTRTLAVFRVFVGLLILADLLLRSRNFEFFYTEEGVVPRSLAIELSTDNAFSFYHATTDPALLLALFVVQALFAFQLIVGYKTRIAMVLSFLFVVSLDHHNPLVTSYADVLFRLLLFWAIFLPLGERWSVDAVLSETPPRGSFVGIASVMILCQMVYMYVVNAYHKSQSELWTGGEATPLVMGLDDMTFLLAPIVREFPTLLQYGGLTWYYMLWASPLLILLAGRLRLPFLLMFVGGHASFAMTVRIGAFAYVALAGLVLFVQTPVWEDAKRLVDRLGLDRERIAGRASGAAAVARRFPTVRLNSERGRWAKSTLYIFAVVLVSFSMVMLAVAPFLHGGGVVDPDGRFAATEDEVDDVASAFAVSQPEWSVFAPIPRTTDRYYVFPARTADGELIDAYNHRELSYDRAHDQLQRQYGTYRERFYMNSVRRGGFDNDVAPQLAEYLCRTYEDDHGVELTHVNMYAVSEDITLETISAHDERDRESELIYKHACGGEGDTEEFEPPDF